MAIVDECLRLCEALPDGMPSPAVVLDTFANITAGTGEPQFQWACSIICHVLGVKSHRIAYRLMPAAG